MIDRQLQQEHAKKFVKEQLGCPDVIGDDPLVFSYLNLKKSGNVAPRCADILGFTPDRSKPTKVVVCESKGTEIDKSLVQLGNATAALLAKLDEQRVVLEPLLVVFVSSLVPLQQEIMGFDKPKSPGPDHIAVVDKKDGEGKMPLFNAGTTETKPFPARASLQPERLEAKMTRWSRKVGGLDVWVVVDPY